jgi:hypothetical protein
MIATGSVTADELVRALDRRGATLPVEIGTFMVLEACEAMLASGPRELQGLANLRVSDHGATSLSGVASEDEAGARSLHRCLAELLSAAGPRLPPALAQLVEKGPPGGAFSLRALRDELEAALVPINRNASRRVLARFARDAAMAPIHPEEVDAALNSLIDASEQPANDVASRPSHSRLTGGDSPLSLELFDGHDLEKEEASFLGGPVSTPLGEPQSVERHTPSVRPSFAPQGGRDSLYSLRSRAAELDDGGAERASSRKLFFGFGLIALVVALVTLVLSLQRGGTAPSGAATSELLKSDLGRAESGDLIVRVPEADAQVFRFVGLAPVTVPNLPVGVAHEFVATAEGHAPARVLVPTDAEWELSSEGARYEVALQLAPVAEPTGASFELGPSRLTKQADPPTARLGSVRVVATPRGARVYQLLGFSPTVELRDLPLAEAEELLVYQLGSAPVLRVVAPTDFKLEGERRVADITVSVASP